LRTNLENGNHPHFNIPILLIGFTRPELIAKQIEVLREVKPKQIYFYLDGPRNHVDARLMKLTNSELNKIDWDVQVTKKIENINSGAAKSITSAISWAFQKEENLIILEDDVLPCIEFFWLCENYLQEDLINYKVGIISGHQIEVPEFNNTLSSQLSKYPRIHGWATQRKVWNSFDYKHKIPNGEFIKQTLQLSKFNPLFFSYLCYVQYKIKLNKLDTWDYQFLYFLNRNQLLTIVPTANLIKNLGYGLNATNTKLTGMKEEFIGSGLNIIFKKITELRYSKSGDKNWRKYRIRMLIKSFFQKIIRFHR
jgi:hypothetical protein